MAEWSKELPLTAIVSHHLRVQIMAKTVGLGGSFCGYPGFLHHLKEAIHNSA